MPNTREKLIELIRDGRNKAEAICNDNNDCQSCTISDPDGYCKYGCIADHLIANGVTVQGWISVKDRLPLNDTYIHVTTDGVVVPAYWHNDRFYAFTAIGVATVGGVTHWQPLPEPPKGE